MKKGIFVGALVTLLCIPSYAYAKGTASIEFTGNKAVNVGDEFKVNMVIDNVTDTEGGIVGFGGYIKFDDSVLEIVDAKTANSYFDVYKNDSINKIVGIDMTLNHGITSRTAVYEITFRGINEGNTTVTMTGADLSDKNANEVDANVNGLNVTINAVKPVVEEVKPVYTAIKEDKAQTQETVVEEIVEIKEETVEQKEIKTTKKVVKKTKKQEKNLLKIVSKFFKKIFKKVA
jgi:hypothetical protein